jgi:AcrR family transcriptional regulator
MERLPRGRHGLSPEFVARNQRARLIAGLIEALHEVGYQKTTVSLIGERAAVSKSDFYKHFDSKDDCFFAAYESVIERIRAQVLEACSRHDEGDWAARARDGIASLLTLLAADPPLAGLALVDGLRAGRGIYDRYQAALESFVPYLRKGAPRGPGDVPLPDETDEAVVGAIASMVGRRVLAGESQQLSALIPDVLEFALTPYLGAVEARRIISAG